MILLDFHHALVICFLAYTESIIALRAFERADEPFIEASNSYDDKQGWLKNQNNLLEPIWQVGPILPSAMVDIVDSVEHEREQEVFIELDDFDDCIEENEDADFSTD